MKKTEQKSQPFGRRFQNGAAAAGFTALVIALVVAVNLVVGALPVSLTQLDASAGGLYTLTDSTKTLLGGLSSDVTFYYIAQEGGEDALVASLLDRYAAAGSRVKWELKDPAVNPTFSHRYDNAAEGSVVAVSGDKFQVIGPYDMYQYSYDANYNTTTSFDGENQLTGAVRYVTSEETPTVYLLQGHKETTLDSDLTSAMKQQNLTTETLNLQTQDAVPENAAAVLMVSPQKDLTEHEAQVLGDYLAGGGSFVLASDLLATPEDTPLLNALMARYGMQRTRGLVVEGDANHYFGTPYTLLPNIGYSGALSGVDRNSYVLLGISEALRAAEDLEDSLTVTELFTTSDSAYLKTGWENQETIDIAKAEGDETGRFALGLYAVKDLSGEDGGSGNEESGGGESQSSAASGKQAQVVWLSTGSILDAQYDARVNGNNSAAVLSLLGTVCGQDVAETGIAAKTIDAETLQVSAGGARMWSVVAMFLVPGALLGIGIFIFVKRRKS